MGRRPGSGVGVVLRGLVTTSARSYRWITVELRASKGASRFVRMRISGNSLIVEQDGKSGKVALAEVLSGLPESALRAALRIAPKGLPLSVRNAVKRRDGQTCRYCGALGNDRHGPDGQPWHIDHRVPRRLGGSDHLDNLRLACSTCNHRKGASAPPSEYIEVYKASDGGYYFGGPIYEEAPDAVDASPSK